MTLPTPNLDDRTFQDLVREARAMIPRYCPEWTDHNLSDPGITLIELFAWMVETLIYRLNKVPDKNYVKFMELIGIHLQPPNPARVNVTFRLSAALPNQVIIPQGTEVATLRTETQDAIVFTTDEDLTITPPKMEYALTSADNKDFQDCLSELKNPDILVTVFQKEPKEHNALYLGFGENLNTQTLALSIKCKIEGIGVDPSDPPLIWEFWDGEFEKWSALRVELDSTGGLNINGQVILHVPYTCTVREVNGLSACWIRCRVIEARPGQRPYTSSPMVASISTDCVGGTIAASNALVINGEQIGRSNGTPGQNFFLKNIPVLNREQGETLEVENDDGEFEPWHEVTDFARSGANIPHFTIDGVSGEIQFGPSIKAPSGEERQYGSIPPIGRRIRFTRYRSGGGIIGNVGEKTITVLKSSIPYVASVINFLSASGGTDPETMESAKMRVPRVLRDHTRAVTCDDFEYMALQASSSIARAKCVSPGSMGSAASPEPGVVRLLLIPYVPLTDKPIAKEQLELTKRIREDVQTYLDERRLLGTRLEILTPKYVPVAVEARIKGKPNTDFGQITKQIQQALYRYINPVYGGTDGKGLPFGEGITLSEIHATIYGAAKFDYIENVKLFHIDPMTGERMEAVTKVSVPIDSLICSHVHTIVVE